MTAGSEVATFGNPVVRLPPSHVRRGRHRRDDWKAFQPRGAVRWRSCPVSGLVSALLHADLKGFSSGSPKNLAECQESCSFARPLLLGNEIILDEGNSR